MGGCAGGRRWYITYDTRQSVDYFSEWIDEHGVDEHSGEGGAQCAQTGEKWKKIHISL